MENIEFQLNEVFHEIVNRMETEGAFDREAYQSYVDELIEEKIGAGQLDPDANTENYKESLMMMWPQAEELISKTDESGRLSLEDEGELNMPPGDEDGL